MEFLKERIMVEGVRTLNFRTANQPLKKLMAHEGTVETFDVPRGG